MCISSRDTSLQRNNANLATNIPSESRPIKESTAFTLKALPQNPRQGFGSLASLYRLQDV
jgi:hypothetical protein